MYVSSGDKQRVNIFFFFLVCLGRTHSFSYQENPRPEESQLRHAFFLPHSRKVLG